MVLPRYRVTSTNEIKNAWEQGGLNHPKNEI